MSHNALFGLFFLIFLPTSILLHNMVSDIVSLWNHCLCHINVCVSVSIYLSCSFSLTSFFLSPFFLPYAVLLGFILSFIILSTIIIITNLRHLFFNKRKQKGES